MEFITSIFSTVRPAVPMTIVIVLIGLTLYIIQKFFDKREATRPKKSLWRHLIILVTAIVGLLILVLVSPISDTEKSQLLSLLGLLLSAAIALSSATFLGNAMGGVMLRAVRSFKMGDFIQVGDHFGRVTERGLFHIEIQTEYRDLVTLPNLYLVKNPVKVLRSSGTILKAEVSLGYDIPHFKVEELLLDAAKEAGLTDAFILIMKLGDFSITYRVAGMLTKVKRVITARSRLRAAMLDKLHEGGIEIVSPTLMTTRSLPPSHAIVPDERTSRTAAPKETPGQTELETMAFDKADKAESAQKLKERLDTTTKKITELNEQLKEAGEKDGDSISKSIANLEQIKERTTKILQAKADKLEEDD
jgi:small-conductance mechanosensitive channel